MWFFQRQNSRSRLTSKFLTNYVSGVQIVGIFAILFSMKNAILSSSKKWEKCNTNELRDPAGEIRKARIKAFRFFKDGKTKREAAYFLRLHERTVGRWYERFVVEGNPKNWKTTRGARAGDKITGGKEDLIKHLKGILRSKAPQDFRLPHAKWNVKALASYIETKYGKRPSLRTIYRYLRVCSASKRRSR